MKIVQAILSALILVSAVALAEEEKMPAVIAWDLSELYASPVAWNQDRESVLQAYEDIAARKASFGKNATTFFETLQLISDTERKLSRVYTYASLLSDEDLRHTDNQETEQLAQIAYAKFGEAIAWLEPAILALGKKKVSAFQKKNKALDPYRYYLDNVLRAEAHTLSAEGESLLALFATPSAAPANIYSLVANSDIPWPDVSMSDGKTYRIDAAGYSRWRSVPNREDRKKAFDAYWGRWKDYRNSVGAVLNAHIQNQVAMARARHYDSVLQRELDQDNLPEAIYRNLVKEVNDALPTLHRYFKLRAKILGVKNMQYYDIYPPLVELDKNFDYENSKAITLEAMGMLGEDWVQRQRAAMAQRWDHVYPQQGKRSGAYMNGSAYDVHPYILLNHDNDYESLSTLAHEWGHAMHTLYASESQPYQTYDYATFIAEIPSTSLELILQQYMVQHASTTDEKIFYLGSGLERLRGTFFRQTMFAEFELKLYEAVEKGEALSGEKISAMYGDILKRYHGSADNVVGIDDLYTNEWMFVPHFYYNMYVYQYATSITAGTALYEKMLSEGQVGVDNYINLLRAGGSDYPHELLKKAGVDLTKPEPFRAIVQRMNLIMDEMETLIEKK